MWEFIILSTVKSVILKSLRQRPHPGAGSHNAETDEVRREGAGKGSRRDKRKEEMAQEGLEGMTMPHRGWRSPPGPAVLMGTGHHHPNRSLSEISFFRTHFQTLPQKGLMAQISFSGTSRTRTFCLIELRKTPGCPQRDSLTDPPKALRGPDLTGGEEVLKHKATL